MRPTKEQLAKIKLPAKDPRDPTRVAKRRPAQLSGKGGAQQGHRDEVNINSIIANYQNDQRTPPLNPREPLYADFTDAGDLHTQMTRVAHASSVYEELPAAVRSASDNDPVRFLEMFFDDTQRPKLEEAGLEVADLEQAVTEEAAQATSPSPPEKPPEAEPPQPPDGGEENSSST